MPFRRHCHDYTFAGTELLTETDWYWTVNLSSCSATISTLPPHRRPRVWTETKAPPVVGAQWHGVMCAWRWLSQSQGQGSCGSRGRDLQQSSQQPDPPSSGSSSSSATTTSSSLAKDPQSHCSTDPPSAPDMVAHSKRHQHKRLVKRIMIQLLHLPRVLGRTSVGTMHPAKSSEQSSGAPGGNSGNQRGSGNPRVGQRLANYCTDSHKQGELMIAISSPWKITFCKTWCVCAGGEGGGRSGSCLMSLLLTWVYTWWKPIHSPCWETQYFNIHWMARSTARVAIMHSPHIHCQIHTMASYRCLEHLISYMCNGTVLPLHNVWWHCLVLSSHAEALCLMLLLLLFTYCSFSKGIYGSWSRPQL